MSFFGISRGEPSPVRCRQSGEAELAIKSVVTLSLTPKGAGTLLRMEQTGFRPDQQQNYQGAKYGWQHFLTKLEQVVVRAD